MKDLAKFILTMYDSHHSDFILSPLRNILEEGILACKSVGDGIETYPLCEYIMQSLFLKMTGAQEQKLKCICWDMATVDYEYRSEFLNNRKGYSKLKEKNEVYKSLVDSIKVKEKTFDTGKEFDINFISDVFKKTNDLYANSHFPVWQSREYNLFVPGKYMNHILFGKSNMIYTDADFYEKVVYNHRNRCAHNTLSYQQNKPDLSKLSAPDYDQCNYFYRFTLLVIIDEIFMKLWRKYVGLYSNTGI